MPADLPITYFGWYLAGNGWHHDGYPEAPEAVATSRLRNLAWLLGIDEDRLIVMPAGQFPYATRAPEESACA